MNKMVKILRNIHGWLGFIFSGFLIVMGVTGIILVFRKEIPRDLKNFVFKLHTYEFDGLIFLKYWTIVIGLVLLVLSISGIVLFINIWGKIFLKKRSK